jgi:hypothetical protein
MKSILVGRLILLILVIGLAIGGYRLWQARSGSSSDSPSSGFSLSKLFNSGGDKSASPGTSTDEVTVLTTATKAQWLDDEVAAFNSANQGKYHVTRLPLLESRDGMHAILEGKAHPVIWSPSSPVWIARLQEVWNQQHNGQTIADLDDPQSYRVFLKSPLVVLTTRSKASFFRPIFESTDSWSQIRALSLGRRRTPWGSFRFAHADPLDASSGMLTMTLVLTEYARETNYSGSMEQMAASSGFGTYLTELERGFVYDPAATGSTALERAYTSDPSSRDFITAYESKALDAIAQNPDLVMIYPNPTAVADQSAAVLSADWVSSKQKEGAEAFLAFLGSEQAVHNGGRYHFRPEQTGTEATLAADIQAPDNSGFRESYTVASPQPYAALNEAANQWRIHVAHR